MLAEHKGQLPDPPLHRTFHDLALVAQTGALHLENDGVRKCVYFERGCISFATTSRPDERLGALAVRERLVTWWQVQEAAREIGAEKRLGGVMVDLGILAPEECNRLVRDQLREIVVEALDWGEGTFCFEDGISPDGEMITLDWPVAEAFLAHSRRQTDERKLWLGVGGLEGQLIRIAGEALPPAMGLHSGEKRVVAAVQDGRTVQEIIRVAAVPPAVAVRTLHSLLLLGAFRVVPGAHLTMPKPPPGRPVRRETENAPPKPAGRYAMVMASREQVGRPRPALLPAEVRGERAALLDLVEGLPRMDHYQVLELRPGAAPAEIDRAFHMRSARFHVDRATHPAFTDLGGALERAQHAVQIAHRVLADPEARSDYDAHREEQHQARQRVAAAVEESAQAYLGRGSRLIREGRLADAIPPLQEAVRLRPDLTVAHYRLGQCLATMPGQREQARHHFRRAGELEPENRRYQDALLTLKERARPARPRLARTLQRLLHLAPPEEER